MSSMIVSAALVRQKIRNGTRRFYLTNITAERLSELIELFDGLTVYQGHPLLVDVNTRQLIETHASANHVGLDAVDAGVFLKAYTVPDRFWTVLAVDAETMDDPYIPEHRRSTVRQFSEEDAQRECERLAAAHPGLVFFKMRAEMAASSTGVNTVSV